MSDKNGLIGNGTGTPLGEGGEPLCIDSWRSFVFPNHIRTFRKERDGGSLLELSERLSGVTYIRLSKIERGEVFARAAELRAIGEALAVAPEDLLIDIDDPHFDIADWAEPNLGSDRVSHESDRFAVLVAAALRNRRNADPELTIAALENDYGIAPVILSRIENAFKPFERWNEDIRSGLYKLFAVRSNAVFIRKIEDLYGSGDLDETLPLIANPKLRIDKTRTRVNALRAELAQASPVAATQAHATIESAPALPEPAIAPTNDNSARASVEPGEERMVPVFGFPLPEGQIARLPTDTEVPAPRMAGPASYGLRVGYPTLGPGLPGRATLIVDPDRFPSAGSIAVVSEAEGILRLLSITHDRQGRMIGFSLHPDYEIAIDELDPGQVGTVIAAIYE
ncbi:helix-turn-helix domain-containing protein [Novosphingobium aureum]|uniref:helix-turn-helix domain-containing protein n=1 Tax=Novosphingobium aureum TaxID=2792964 RepID=UPI001E516E92|nr:helix-turn-helix transcriptional regulator [Novosphingobium aureum]